MELRLHLHLPVDVAGIPVARRLLRSTLTAFDVTRDCVDELELALAEACANVCHHAGLADRFEVVVRVAYGRCVIEVIDQGVGFDPDLVRGAGVDAERGRGLALMRAVLDQLDFAPGTQGGTVARLSKQLSWALAARPPEAATSGPTADPPAWRSRTGPN
jgi:serine/threonine-protein kinase RsbW